MLNVIRALFFRELKTRFGKNRHLGYFWVIGEPLAQVFVITLFVSIIREHIGRWSTLMPDGITVYMFLACGIIPFFMFRSIITQLMNGIQSNLTLFAYKPVRPIHVFITRALLEFCIYSAIFVVLMILVGWFVDFKVVPRDFLGVFFCVCLMVISGVVIGLCFAIATHLMEPLRMVLTYIPTVLYILSGVIFPIWIIPSAIVQYFLYNPLLHVMEYLKFFYFDGYPMTDGVNLIYPLTFNLILLFVGLWFYYYKRRELVARKQ
ncbi:MAG: ABC transporter permease [Helicobacter sp.]|nr:ABC transporter permease [Helicobacteraceae bacterium]MDY3114011.1 ABC transporter permease [Helicobacter sp.]